MATALVVDDSPGDRHLAAVILQSANNARVIRAASGREALALLEREKPDVVVTDLRMIDMSGLEVLEEIHNRNPSLPVILMTAYGSEEIAAEALRRGAASYVPKRYLLRDLGRTVEMALAAAATSTNRRRLFHCTQRLDANYRLENDSSLIYPLVSHLQEYLEPMGICEETERLQVGIALVEALLNALYHGNLELGSDMREEGESPFYEAAKKRMEEAPFRNRHIVVSAHLSPEKAVYVIRDEGKGFDPSIVPDPTEPANIERSSGRGLLLIRTFMDEVWHNDVGNEITMIKYAPEFRPAH